MAQRNKMHQALATQPVPQSIAQSVHCFGLFMGFVDSEIYNESKFDIQ